MPRVKRGMMHAKRRRNLLKLAKGYRWGRKSKIKLAKVAVVKAGVYARRDRRAKKGNFRALWNLKINAALREQNMSYSRFIGMLKKANITLDRKILAELAEHEPSTFSALVNAVRS
ncbi:MAG: 50S ribosomal protein L20 [Candidatus Komeilibacteria bacterium RIFCSPLOWO2_01_FULL_52_15]|uniref:Large ribosomal subunit protein bL20 n=2 Tax=Candidatus Komeiliibacteriota TaxID=1817908 RepID=A0A1G2BQD3_9BACT|nr:MAG: 50S ribosomal protein L20 [Candidatus Komeilibacteria bacterium RIFCSPHIGHO2_01_FULL_52_14]OGY91332.1 MAG: 50S ribosomal protein L20 [Candidatus Komeilibacteria bacterium RIFCSPLOWO2_01_FULL_52_15]